MYNCVNQSPEEKLSIAHRIGRLNQRVLAALLLLGSLAALTYSVYRFGIQGAVEIGSTPIGIDWLWGFRPAIQLLLDGQSPYNSTFPVYSPPWILGLLIPFSLLPTTVGAAVYTVFSWLAYLFVAYRLGARPLALVAIGLAQPVLQSAFIAANVDWMPLIGALMPPQIGLFFLSAKPHLGIGLALFWLWGAWQKGKFREVIRVFGPVTIAWTISFVVFGPFLFASGQLINSNWSATMFPYSLPIGVVLMALAVHFKDRIPALAASPFFSPYVGKYSWGISLFALIKYPGLLVISSVLLWFGWFYSLQQ